MPEPSWVRVRLAGVGTWSQREDAQMPEGAVVLDGEPALDPAGRAIPDVPEDPTDAPPAAAGEQPSGDTSGDAPDGADGADEAGTEPATEPAAGTGTRRR